MMLKIPLDTEVPSSIAELFEVTLTPGAKILISKPGVQINPGFTSNSDPTIRAESWIYHQGNKLGGIMLFVSIRTHRITHVTL